MLQEWMPGDLVTVATVNRGLPVWRKRTVEMWHGTIMGPSLIGPGWWNVKRSTPRGSGRHGSVFAVPAAEIETRKR